MSGVLNTSQTCILQQTCKLPEVVNLNRHIDIKIIQSEIKINAMEHLQNVPPADFIDVHR